MVVKIVQGDALSILKTLKSDCINTCITSPPYWGLRDYGCPGQLGLEPSPDLYVQNMVDIFRQVRRCLRPDGTLWLNLGDSYAGSGRGGNPDAGTKLGTNKGSQTIGVLYGREQDGADAERARVKQQFAALSQIGSKPKDLVGIPWRVAFALQADGWYLRQDIIWAKPNPMPESVRDRCTKSHEYLFLLSKEPKYYFDADAVREPMAAASVARLSQDVENQTGSTRVPGKTNGNMKAVRAKGNARTFRGGGNYTQGQSFDNSALIARESHGNAPNETGLRNRRSVWTITTKPFKEAHFATFPPDLVEPCALAGCPTGGYILDPFAGSGTVGMVANKLNRHAILFELNLDYVEMAKRRCNLTPAAGVTLTLERKPTMPLSEQEKTDLRSLDAEGSRQEIKTQCHRIHRATHDGSLDRPAVDDALARIAVINKSHDDAPVPQAKPVGPVIAGKPFFEQPAPAPSN